MSDIYKRFAVVVAELERLRPTNEDPIRFSKRRCINAAFDALSAGIANAEQAIGLIESIESDFAEVLKEVTP